mmetsp:Transcript_1794/g.1518  ORF Transcript_1794/g.1518 Transcript_1794/m.1518 type:complete len:92 (-) Transcript_1794:38-313(-)
MCGCYAYDCCFYEPSSWIIEILISEFEGLKGFTCSFTSKLTWVTLSFAVTATTAVVIVIIGLLISAFLYVRRVEYYSTSSLMVKSGFFLVD